MPSGPGYALAFRHHRRDDVYTGPRELSVRRHCVSLNSLRIGQQSLAKAAPTTY